MRAHSPLPGKRPSHGTPSAPFPGKRLYYGTPSAPFPGTPSAPSPGEVRATGHATDADRDQPTRRYGWDSPLTSDLSDEDPPF